MKVSTNNERKRYLNKSNRLPMQTLRWLTLMEHGCAAGRLRRLFTLLRFAAVNIPPTLRRLSALLRFTAVMQPLDLRLLSAFSYCTAVIISPSKEHVFRLTSFTNVNFPNCKATSLKSQSDMTPFRCVFSTRRKKRENVLASV